MKMTAAELEELGVIDKVLAESEELEEVPSSEKLYKNREDVHYQNENGAFRGAKFDDKFLDSIWDEMLN